MEGHGISWRLGTYIAFERKINAVAPVSFTANGGTFGLVTISDTATTAVTAAAASIATSASLIAATIL